jgi:hypothetical protein
MENSMHQGPGPVVQADIDKIVGEVTANIIGALVFLGTVGFLAYQVGKAVISDAETRGKYRGKDEARDEAEAEAERAEARHRSRVDQLEKELDELRNS